ncbi:hypothetical protein [Cryobacterium sp. MDB2-10]|uniref:hypothetical protein n=1 Tax=Cryobacterium sp. MDB2-10 TaxID=1259177 RepID=UPI0010734428|nr:hypothetical protein [Cryobacterium sp. MDB2-10]TFC19900.1 hypothetical protein E3O51_06065 [Cryobacterium sp. MDB2-10]
MTVDEGRAWALKQFGHDGVRVREAVPRIIRAGHEDLATAQMHSNMKTAGVYGNIWRRCLDDFVAELGTLPSAEVFAPYRAGYRVVRFQGTVLFPWRYARDATTEVESRRFAVSSGRKGLWQRQRAIGQPQLDIPDERPELTDEDLTVLEENLSVVQGLLQEQVQVVVVNFSSSPRGIYGIEWGMTRVDGEGRLIYDGFRESLLTGVSSALVDLNSSTEGFAAGPIHRPTLSARKVENGKS